MEVVERVTDALVRAVDMRDGYTGRHSEAVAELAARVGARVGLAGMQLRLLSLTARLHDIGKLAVPDAVLHKTGPLEEGEWEAMRRHAAAGADMLLGVPGLEPVAPVVRWHHERWDGHGYPDGIAAEEIPMVSRIVGACDALDAMTTGRPYRQGLRLRAALAELRDGAGTQFDPEVVAAIEAEARPRRPVASVR